MSNESAFIASLQASSLHPAARGLADDAALFEGLIYTHDMLVEGTHYLAKDPPEDVAWKLLAVNLSDLAAKGATPLAALMGYALTNDSDWDMRFVTGLNYALKHSGIALIGGDTVALPAGAPRVLSLTAIGRAGTITPSRAGAQTGDGIYVTGTIGDAGLGLRAARGEFESGSLLAAYRRPVPQLAAGQILAPHVTSIMDISDGLLIDAQRMASASKVQFQIELASVPLSDALRKIIGDNLAVRLAAVTAGDDYQLLFTTAAPPPADLSCAITKIGAVVVGSGLMLHNQGEPIALPSRLGWEH